MAERRRVIDTRRGLIACLLAFFLVGLPAFFAFEAWYQAGTGIITVKDIGKNSPDRRNHIVVDISDVYFVVRGARYPMFGGQSADEVWRELKVGCRYEISYYYHSSGDALLSRDGMALSGAALIDCPPKAHGTGAVGA